MLQNSYFLAKIGADTAENEQHFAEILPTDAEDLAEPRGRERAELRLSRRGRRGVRPGGARRRRLALGGGVI